MDEARDRITREIVSAIQLRNIECVNKDGYVCIGCGAKATPAAYDYGKQYKVSAYFFSKPHNQNCEFHEEEELIKRAKTKHVSIPREGFSGRFPTKISFDDVREIVETDETAGTSRAVSEPRNPNNQGAQGDVVRGQTVSTIRQVCRFFMNFPHNRDRELIIPGIDDAREYRYAFRRLDWFNIIHYPKPRIFYAPLARKPLIPTDESLEILLYAGERGSEDRGQIKRPYRVRLLWKAWSNQAKSYIENRITALLSTTLEAENHAWLFFMGKQAEGQDDLFIVDNHRKVAAWAGRIEHPK